MDMDDQKNFKRAINLDIGIIKIKNPFMSYFKRATMRRIFFIISDNEHPYNYLRDRDTARNPELAR